MNIGKDGEADILSKSYWTSYEAINIYIDRIGIIK